jgi:flagellar hook-length control protein FliK
MPVTSGLAAPATAPPDRGSGDATSVRLQSLAASALHGDGSVTVADDPDTPLSAQVASEARAATTPQAAAPPPIAAHPAALAQGLSRQLAQALTERQGSEGVIEIALDPPELGRVRLSFAEAGGTLTLAITADRPETAELMRRHLSLLAQEFQRAGLDAPNVDISDRHGGSRNEGRTRADNPGTILAPGPEAEDRPTPSRSSRGGGEGLDLRL